MREFLFVLQALGLYNAGFLSSCLSLPLFSFSLSLPSFFSFYVVFHSLFIHLYMQQTRQIFFWYIDLQNILALRVSKHTLTPTHTQRTPISVCVCMCVLDTVSVSFIFFCIFFPLFSHCLYFMCMKNQTTLTHTHIWSLPFAFFLSLCRSLTAAVCVTYSSVKQKIRISSNFFRFALAVVVFVVYVVGCPICKTKQLPRARSRRSRSRRGEERETVAKRAPKSRQCYWRRHLKCH